MTYVHTGFHLHETSEGSFGIDKSKTTGRSFSTFHVATVKTSTLKLSAISHFLMFSMYDSGHTNGRFIPALAFVCCTACQVRLHLVMIAVIYDIVL